MEHFNLFDKKPSITFKDIVMLGDSLTKFGGNWNRLLTGEDCGPYINRGIIGENIMQIYDRLYQILPYHPHKIFLMAGVNDISNDLSVDDIIELYTMLIEKIRRDTPETILYIQSLLPVNEDFHCWKTMVGKTDTVYAVNTRLLRYALSQDLTYIDLFSLLAKPGTHSLRKELSIDGLHLRPAGYKIWSKALQPFLN